MSETFDVELSIGAIRDGDRVELCAGDDERRAICARLGLASLGALQAHSVIARDGDSVIARDGDSVTATGRLAAKLEQACVATGEPVPAAIDEPFELKFLPEPASGREAEIELGADDLDVVFHDGSRIALGAALVDTLALALEPYPRGPNAELALREAGVMSEDEAGPFAALAALKGKLGKE
jgi:uncharacterized metal-binding protein YceD (DUF177 family)